MYELLNLRHRHRAKKSIHGANMTRLYLLKNMKTLKNPLINRIYRIYRKNTDF